MDLHCSAILRFGFKILLGVSGLGLLAACERIPEWERQGVAAKSMEESQRFSQLKRWLWTCRAVPSHYQDEKKQKFIGPEIENFVDHYRTRGLSSLDTSSSKTILGTAFLWSDAGILISWLPWFETVHDIECSNGVVGWLPATVKGSDRALDLVVLGVNLPSDSNFRSSNRWLLRSEPLALGENLQVVSSSSVGLTDLMRVNVQPSQTNLHTGVDEALILYLPKPAPVSEGGILVDEKWRVVGYTLPNSSATWGSAIRMASLEEIVSMIQRKGKVSRPYIGFKVRHSSENGFTVSQVEVGGPAHQAGIRVQDTIMKWDFVNLKNLSDWKELGPDSIGRTIAVTYQRGGKTIETQITPSIAD